MNTAFKKQSQEAQQLLEVCAQRLKDQPSLLNHFINKSGNQFYQEDLGQMSRYPPQYGMSANFRKSKANPTNSPDPEPELTSPGTVQIKLSVMKGLWFPIMTNLTNLAMDT